MYEDLNFNQILTLHELALTKTIQTDSWTLSCTPIDHYDGIAFRLDAEGKSFVHSGAMGYDERISSLGKNADIVAIECSFPDISSRLGKHLCAEDVGKLANKGHFKHTVVTHLYPQCEGKEQHIIDTISSLADTKVTIAHDFYSIEV
jgi:ribonuclease BN (tRNA processing enzyme)